MPTTTIILLRRLDQPIEILTSAESRAGPDSLRVLASPAAGHLGKFKEADLLYSVDLPSGCEIRPADWRPLIDDRDALELLILELVIQNVAPARFEPLTATLLRRLESTLRLALTDVTRAFDVGSVNCELPPDDPSGVLVTVSGDHKNGDRRQVVIPVLGSD
jgi:hypothetical protein